MKRFAGLLAVLALLGGAGGCGSTNTRSSSDASGDLDKAKAGEDVNASEGELGGGDSASFRSGFMTCQLYPLEELARQNGVKPDKGTVAKAVAALEATARDKKDVRAGCMKALNVGSGG